MRQLAEKYTKKLHIHGLTEKDAAVFGTLETDIEWSRPDKNIKLFEKIFKSLNINVLLYSELAEPYKTLIDYLADKYKDKIIPQDSETRTFLHDLPIASEFSAEAIVPHLKVRKGVIIPGYGIITFGTVSPEQAFVNFSSVNFSCFVKFFTDYLAAVKSGKVSREFTGIFEKVASKLKPLPKTFPPLLKGPFKNEKDVYTAVSESGRLTVDFKLVDSYFGNVSCLYNNTLYISQTTSSLDELDGMIDPCPLNNSSCAGVTASSELPAHLRIVREDPGIHTVLHGHPKFSVIMSINCDVKGCTLVDSCHKSCPHIRMLEDIPIVPGESGTGKYGLVNTMPPAVKGKKAAIVYGHGVFSTGKVDFNEAFDNLLYTERTAFEEYFKRTGG